MKQKTNLIMIMGILGILIMSGACNLDNTITSHQVYMFDGTDPTNMQLPEVEMVQANFPSSNIFNGMYFKARSISSVYYSSMHEIGLEQASALSSNEPVRKEEVKSFKNGIADILQVFKNQTGGKTHSVILEPIFEELALLAVSEDEDRRLYVYSDLHHYNPNGGINFYDEDVLNALKYEPNIVRERIENEYSIEDNLVGVEVYFIYTGTDFQTVQTFESLSKVLKYILEKHGAKVYIKTHF